MKIKRIFNVLFTVLLTAVCTVSAETAKTPEIKIDFDSGTVAVSGEAKDNNDVLLQVLNPGIDVEKIDALEQAKKLEMFNHVEEKSAEGGKYTFTYTSEGENGTYTVMVKASSDKAPAITSFNFANAKTAADDIKILNGYITAKSVSDIESFLNTNSELYFADISFYKNLSLDGKTKVAEGLIENGELLTVADAKNAVIKYSVIQRLYEETDDLKRGKLLTEYAKELGLDKTEEYTHLKDEDDEFLKDFGERIKEVRLAGYEEFLTAYKTCMCLTGIKYAENIGLIRGIVKRASDANIINVPEYLALGSTAFVDEKIIKQDFEKASDLEAKLEEYAKDGEDEDEGGSYSSGGGGGGTTITKPAAIITTTPANLSDNKLFSDLDENHFAYESVLSLTKLGAINGYGDGSFKPGQSVTRKEFLKIALTAFKIEDETAKASFIDVSEDDWCYLWIATAQSLGIISGDDLGSFNGNSNITRQDAAKILNGILTFKGLNIPAERGYAQFADESEISEYAKESVEMFYNSGVISGYGDGTFKPKANASRAETAKMIFAVLQKIGG